MRDIKSDQICDRQLNIAELPALAVGELFDCECLCNSSLPLTRAELAVASQYIIGHTYGDIAESRNVSKETIKRQVSNIFQKTGCRRRVDLVMLVIEKNLTRLRHFTGSGGVYGARSPIARHRIMGGGGMSDAMPGRGG